MHWSTGRVKVDTCHCTTFLKEFPAIFHRKICPDSAGGEATQLCFFVDCLCCKSWVFLQLKFKWVFKLHLYCFAEIIAQIWMWEMSDERWAMGTLHDAPNQCHPSGLRGGSLYWTHWTVNCTVEDRRFQVTWSASPVRIWAFEFWIFESGWGKVVVLIQRSCLWKSVARPSNRFMNSPGKHIARWFENFAPLLPTHYRCPAHDCHHFNIWYILIHHIVTYIRL